MKKYLFLILFGLLSSTALAQSEASALYPLVNQYNADAATLDRKYALNESPEYIDRMKRFYADWLFRLQQQNFKKYSVNEKVDYLMLKRNIEKGKSDLAETEEEYKQVLPAIPFASLITGFEMQRRVGKQPDGKAVAADFASIVKSIADTRKSLVANKDFSPRQYILAAEAVGNMRKLLTEAFKFYDGYDPKFTMAAKKSYQDADKALDEYVDFLTKAGASVKQKDDGTGIIGNPIGRDGLIKGLQYEMIAYTPEELEAIAMKEFAWCDAEMLKASAAMGFGTNWKAALEKVKTLYVEPGKQPELVKFLADEAINFVENNNLITIPDMAKEGWRMRMLSPQEQKFAPFFLGGESVLIAYPTESMSEEDKMMTLRGNNRHFSRAVVHHELIPGHNLQYYMQSRYKPYRRSFGTSFWSEGWSLYWEMLLWDKNFALTPEDKIGMLFWRMHRCARIIFSLNYHQGKWTPKQCIDFLVDRVGFERANAEAEVRRSFTGGYGPLYQIGYMMGGLQFRALHKELVESGKMSDKKFHDRIMQENSMPVEMVRALLINQKLTEDYTTRWKFAGELK